MFNATSYDDMISPNNKIKFLNLYEFKNDKIMSEVFKNKKDFFICQKEFIITNPHAFNCCDYNFETDDCNYVGPSLSILDSTLIETTEGKLIKTSLVTVVTDKPSTQITKNIDSSELVSNSNSTIELTTVISTQKEEVKSTITKTDTVSVTTHKVEQIATTSLIENKTSPTNKVETETTTTTKTTITTPTSNITVSNPDILQLILLGLSNFKNETSHFSFKIYFISAAPNIFYPEKIYISLTLVIDNSTNIKTLKISKAFSETSIGTECTLQGEETEVKAEYLCEVDENIAGVKQIKLGTDFKFDGDNKVNLVGITPLAKMYLNNTQDIGDKFNNLNNSNIYILDNSTFSKTGNLLFNITGVMNNAQLNITSDNIALMINSDSDNQIEVTCGIQNLVENKYTLNCESSEEIKADLQGAISFIDNDILIINFDENYDSQIVLEKSTNNNNMKGYLSRKHKGGINAGAIVGIVFACIAAVAFIVAIMICRNKENHNDSNIIESTIVKMK